MRPRFARVTQFLGLACFTAGLTTVAAAEPAVDFTRDIRPILSDACYHCHGPDKAKRKARLRLDSEADVFADRDGHKIVVPGEPDKSELYLRITATEQSERMPPVKSGRKLTRQQI